MKKIVLIAFNYGVAGQHVNGPGICLHNFCTFLKRNFYDIEITVFTHLKAKYFKSDIKIRNTKNFSEIKKKILEADVVHHWSGLGESYKLILNYANNLNKKVIIGPNVLDCVEFEKEADFLKNVKFDKILTTNEMLKFKISKRHKILADYIDIFLVGPDTDLWYKEDGSNNKILWKGNSKHFVKDVDFALSVAKNLKQYDFEFIGYPNPYDYISHIELAKKCKLFFVTSLSETMCMAMAEQWAAGIPSVSHPKVYLHGANYYTGIITNRTVDDYCKAITEIMENDSLYAQLSSGAENYIKDSLSPEKMCNDYLEIIGE
jgi:glycosyltransferase involved in cell wall biosynthesis